MRKFSAVTATAGLALACCGCDAATEKALHEEIVRHVYSEQLGPVVVASIVGSAAPCGGPSMLHALCTDHAWGVLFASAGTKPDAEFVPSMFEVPDPNRPVQIGPSLRVR